MPEELTAEEHLDYLESSCRLMLWFLWRWIDEHPDETFADTVQNRTDIFRRTSLNPNHIDGAIGKFDEPEWLVIMESLEALYRRNRQHGSVEIFENEAIAVLQPYLLPRVERDLDEIHNKADLAGYQCGSLRYNLETKPETPQRIGFHIANACSPASPFDDPLYFPRCFTDLMRQCEEKFQVTEITTGTWLNSYPRWLKLFPQEWIDHMGPPDHNVKWHYGFWGQFLTSRRTFNHKLGKLLRETGKMPFPQRGSWCGIEEMRRHLRALTGRDLGSKIGKHEK